jgi:putative ABC transport system ATP-binding protein
MSTTERVDPVVDLCDVRRIYTTPEGPFAALDGVSLQVPRASFTAVVGKSGSGKSTLLHLVAGIDRATSGTVNVAGTAVHTLGESELAAWRGGNVGVVFQSFQLLPALTIAENVMLPMDFCATLPRRQARERALELLERFGIEDQADKLPTAMSGGQQQRAAIARALANDPPLLVADEPTGNLDSQTADAVLELLHEQTRAGKTVVVVTHERDIAASADQVVTLADGRIVDQRRARVAAHA